MFRQVCNSNQAHDAHSKDVAAKVLAHENVHSEGRYTLFNLEIKPHDIILVKKLQTYQFFINVRWKSFNCKPRYIGF